MEPYNSICYNQKYRIHERKGKMKKLSKVILSISLLLLGMTFASASSVSANTGDKEIIIRGTVGLDLIDWDDSYEFNVFMNEENNPNGSISETVNSKKRKFEFKVQIPYGTTKEYDIGQVIPENEERIKGVAYDGDKYHLTINVSDNGETLATVQVGDKSKTINKDILDLNTFNNTGATFSNKYNSKAKIVAGTSTTLKGGTWDKGTKLSHSFSETIDSNSTTGSVWTQKGGLNKQDNSFGNNIYIRANEERIEHRYIKKIDTNIRSVISDSTVYEVWFKIIDNGDGTNEVFHSFDGVNYVLGDTANVSFVDTYFKRPVEVVYNSGNTNKATFELYEYTDGDASMSNASKLFVDEFMIKDGKLSIDVKEGKYFLVEKNNQESNENVIYSFEVTRDNYTEKKVFQINKEKPEDPQSPVEPGETSKNPTVAPESVSDSNSIKASVKTADDTNLMISLLAMLSALYGILYFGKKSYLNKR